MTLITCSTNPIVGRECDKKTSEVTLLERSMAFCMKVIESILNDPIRGATLIFDAVTLKKYKVQNGIEGHTIFFLFEIIQKFFFLAWGFHILASQKKIFRFFFQIWGEESYY